MYLQNVDDVFDLVWTHGPDGRPVTYRDVYHQNEDEQSAYNFEHADVAELFHRFDACELEALRLVELDLPLPAYEQVLKDSHRDRHSVVQGKTVSVRVTPGGRRGIQNKNTHVCT